MQNYLKVTLFPTGNLGKPLNITIVVPGWVPDHRTTEPHHLPTEPMYELVHPLTRFLR